MGTINKSAVKVFERERNLNTELRCYQIVQFHGVNCIEGFQIPELLDFSDDLMVVELTIVSAPYLLDFGKAHFSAPDYPSDATEHYEQRCEDDLRELWPRICHALYELKQLGIYYVDAKPSNINCQGLV